MVKSIFDMLVIEKCTNIKLEGISTETNNETLSIDVKINAEILTKFDNSGLISFVKNHIENYQNALDTIIESIRLKNVQVSLGLIAKTLPSEKEISTSIKNTSALLDKLNKENPELVKKMTESIITQNAKDFAKKEIIDQKKSKKAKVIKKSSSALSKKRKTVKKSVVKAKKE